MSGNRGRINEIYLNLRMVAYKIRCFVIFGIYGIIKAEIIKKIIVENMKFFDLHCETMTSVQR